MSDGLGNLLGIAQQLLGSQQQSGHEPVQNSVTYEIDEKFLSPTHDFWIKNRVLTSKSH
ncbi:hypothetical protein ABZ746_26840 [Streptomyces sp. NPDC020096]